MAGWVGECKKGGKERKEKVEEKSVVVEGRPTSWRCVAELAHCQAHPKGSAPAVFEGLG